MKKVAKYALSGAAIGAILLVVWALIEEYSKQKKQGGANSLNDYLDNLDTNNLKDSAIKGAVGGAIAGLGVLGIQALVAYIVGQTNEEEPFYTEKHFRERLALLKAESKEATESNIHFEIISSLCYDLFSAELVEKPTLHGSRGKKVALAGADYDLALTFNGNRTINEYYHLTFDSLKQKLKPLGYNLREQRFTTGVKIECEDGSVFSLDILPSVIKSDYYLTKNVWIWDSVENRRQQSNIHQHNKQFVGNSHAKDATILCKRFKETTGIELSSPIINKLAPQVLRKKNSHSVHKNFIKVVGAYANKMDNQAYCDPCNSNNNLLNKYSLKQQQHTQSKLRNILSETEMNPRKWAEYI